MDSTSIDLPGSEVESIHYQDGRLTLRFSRALIVKTMTGSRQHTRWWQAGELIIDGASVDGDLPDCPCVCDGGDVGENIYTYRDMIPLPLASKGRSHCELRFQGTERRLRVDGESVTLNMEDRPHYIEHTRG